LGTRCRAPLSTLLLPWSKPAAILADTASARAQIFRRLAEPRSKAKGTRHNAVAGGSLWPRSFGPGSFGPNDAADSSGKAGGAHEAQGRAAEEVASKNVSVAEKAQKCLKIEDETVDRVRLLRRRRQAATHPNPPPVKGILDCRRIVDINERLGCFNGFAVQIPKFTH
jgi:hypothetical protein